VKDRSSNESLKNLRKKAWDIILRTKAVGVERKIAASAGPKEEEPEVQQNKLPAGETFLGGELKREYLL